jgi:hypothetical protein
MSLGRFSGPAHEINYEIAFERIFIPRFPNDRRITSQTTALADSREFWFKVKAMSTSEIQNCNTIKADVVESRSQADCTPVAPRNSFKRVEVAILIVTLVLLVFQGMTFAFVKRVDENLQTIIQTDSFGTSTLSKSEEKIPPKFPGHRRSLSIAH